MCSHACTSTCTRDSLVPRPLPDFISQPWRKIGIKSGSGLRTRLHKGDNPAIWRIRTMYTDNAIENFVITIEGPKLMATLLTLLQY